MGKPTGFIDYLREPPMDRAPHERMCDWSEIRRRMDDKRLRRQAARCMDCGAPFCQTGVIMSGATSGCPLHNLIPEWNDLVYRGLWRDALDRLHMTNNFPEFTGRVCPAPCEGSCVLSVISPPVTIKTIENAIVDRGWDEGWIFPSPPQRRTGKKVAVIGSGPAGLAAAAQLNLAGHSVTVLERADRPGGLLMYGIPNMKLDKRAIVERRLKLLEEEGVRFICNAHVGENVEAQLLRKDFEAIVLCIGATQPRDLPVEGRTLTGVHFAMDYLTAAARALLSGDPDQSPIHARDKHVVVIGGGDTGADCVATALRQSCRSIRQIEIMPQPPIARAADNPWPERPKVHQLDYAHEEAVARFGVDPRTHLTTVKRLIGDATGAIQGVVTVQVEWRRDEHGRLIPIEAPDTEQTHPAQLVLLALGFLGPEPTLLQDLALATGAGGVIAAEYGKFAADVEGVFAAGDCRRGQSLVVWAIDEGRGAARECDRFLMGETQLP